MELNETIQKNQWEMMILLNNSVECLLNFATTINRDTIDQLSYLQSSVNTLNITTMDRLSNLQSSLSLHTRDSTVTNKLDNLRSLSNTHNSTITGKLDNLQILVEMIHNALQDHASPSTQPPPIANPYPIPLFSLSDRK